MTNLLDTELEIKLPSRALLRKVAFLVRQRNADLNDLQQVNIASHCLVVVIGGCLEGSYWASHNPREFRVLNLA
jgi:hypothetical protein